MMITPFYGGLLTILFVILSVRVIRTRVRDKISLGDGGNVPLQRRVRGHGNFAEYVPLALLLMAFLELSRFSIYVLHGMGILLLIGRLLHGYTFSFTERFKIGRVAGAGLTLIVLLVGAVLCVYQGVRAHSVWFAT
jgi:uncharacterized protein